MNTKEIIYIVLLAIAFPVIMVGAYKLSNAIGDGFTTTKKQKMILISRVFMYFFVTSVVLSIGMIIFDWKISSSVYFNRVITSVFLCNVIPSLLLTFMVSLRLFIHFEKLNSRD